MTNPTGAVFLKRFTTKDNPLSMSFGQWYNNMKKCSLKWHFRYNMKYHKHIPKAQIMVDGIDYHSDAEEGYEKIEVVDGQVVMFDEDQLVEKGYTKEQRERLFFLEDWMQTKYEDTGKLPELVGMELSIASPPELICGLWIRRMGVIDMLWRTEDGYFIWDFKTSDIIQRNEESPNFNQVRTSKVNNDFHQLYYYNGILQNPETIVYRDRFLEHPLLLEDDDGNEIPVKGGKVAGVGLVYPKNRTFFRRLTTPVPRGTKNTSRLQDRSMDTIEKHLHSSIKKIMTEPIQPEFNAYYCNEWCDWAQEDTLLCNFESVDLSKLHRVNSLVELQMLAEDLQDGDDWL